MQLRGVIFDVDGTLVDSQGDIMGAMATAFARAGAEMPDRPTILAQVGLSLDVIFPKLLPEAAPDLTEQMVRWYKEAYAAARLSKGSATSSPLYPGARACLNTLHAEDTTLLGVATGKSRRGLTGLIEGHGLQGVFQAQHCADDHPSKPHPAMLEAAIGDLGIAPGDALMIGDTSYDLRMARGAGARFIGVTWGYHGADALAGSDAIVDDFAQLIPALNDLRSSAHV